ncbi:ArnT family glycosyltransferase [Mangrovibacterium sp.]|uniref:ArnT family glycosyltransferase n=1 Tax=Mangrovibacterium sp. TaxID=1961364 RepID=UPI003566F80D
MKYFLLVLLLSLLLFFSFLGGTSVFQVAEARNAECAREMMAEDNWIVPQFNGELRTDKPALEYYGMMTAYLLGGVNETSARFFSAVCGLLLVLATFWIVRRHLSLKAAWWSALVLLSSLHVIIQFRLATPDPYLISFHVLSLYLFYEGWYTRKWRWFAGMYVALGMAVFAKGPVGLLLPGLTMLLFLVFAKTFNWKMIVSMKPWWGILLILAVCLPWYLAVDKETGGEWTQGFFFEHNLNRFNDGLKGHGGPFVLSFLFIIAGMFPFSIFMVRAFKSAWKSRKEEHLLLFSGISVLTVAVFYAFSQTKLINYTAPAYPFFAIITGAYLAKLVDGKFPEVTLKPELCIFALIAIAFPVGAYFYTKNTEPLGAITWISVFFLVLPVGAVLAIRFIKRSLEKGLLTVAVTFMITIFIFFAGPFQIIDEQSPVQKYKEVVQSHENVVAYKDFDHAFAFYAPNVIPVIQTEDELASYLEKHGDVLVLSRDRSLNYMDSIPYLSCVGVDHDLFSRRSSGFYLEK